MTSGQTEFEFKVQMDGALARIDLNRPNEGNTLTLAMMVKLAALIRELDCNPAVNVIAIESTGPYFSRGRDGTGESADGLSAYELRHKLLAPLLDLFSTIANTTIPVVACVHAPAMGFGAAMTIAADITLASDAARFSFPEIHHNIAPTLAISAIMRKVQPKAVSYLIYSGHEITAEEALACGAISKIFPAAQFADKAGGLLKEMAGRRRLLLETIKRFQSNGADLSPAMASEYAGTLMALVRSVK